MSRIIADKIRRKIKLGIDSNENICKIRTKLINTDITRLVLAESLTRRPREQRRIKRAIKKKKIVRGWGGKNTKNMANARHDMISKNLGKDILTN